MIWGKARQSPIFPVLSLNCSIFAHRVITIKNNQLKLFISFLYTCTGDLQPESLLPGRLCINAFVLYHPGAFPQAAGQVENSLSQGCLCGTPASQTARQGRLIIALAGPGHGSRLCPAGRDTLQGLVLLRSGDTAGDCGGTGRVVPALNNRQGRRVARPERQRPGIRPGRCCTACYFKVP